MVADLIRWGCTPGFMTPAVVDPHEAVESVARTGCDQVRRDLVDNIDAGFPLPFWTSGLARSGPAALRLRHRLAAALTHVQDTALEPVLDRLRPFARARAASVQRALAGQGGAVVLDELHPRIGLSGATLQIDLASGAEVDVVSRGAGMVLVPTLLPVPTITVSSEGRAPSVLTVPLALPEPTLLSALREVLPRRKALGALLGTTRAHILEVVADHPGLSTRGLARRIGVSPASVSEHASVLRANGLVDTSRGRTGAAHFVTQLGFDLLSPP